MGCFLHCFGSSQHTKQRPKPPNHHRRNASVRPQQEQPSPQVSSVEVQVQDYSTSTIQAKPNASPRKKVTFDSNVRTYEADEVADFQPEKSEEVTSTESYPTNHRYHNCSHSDDEDGEGDYWDSDLTDDDGDDGDDDGDSDLGEEYDELGEEFEDGVVYSRARNGGNRVCDDEDLNPNARDRSVYVHPVLKPVENLTQWKAVKAKRAPSLMSRKENFILNQESATVSPNKLKHEMAVDASLSNWLVSSETTPERSNSQSSNSVISHEDRPILGSLTVEEIKRFSPRKSLIRCGDEKPIIGSVGTYWNSGDSTSFKGAANRASSRGVHLK